MTTVNLSNDKKRENVKANDGQQYVYVVESSKGANLRNVDKDTVKLEGNAADYSIKATAAGVIITSDDKQFKVVATLQRVNERKDLATGELTIEFADGKTLVVERGAEKGQFGKVFLVGADGAKEELSKQGVDADDLFPTDAPTEEPTNSLTEALEDLQAAQAAEGDALEALEGFVEAYEGATSLTAPTDVDEAEDLIADVEGDVVDAEADVQTAIANLASDRATNGSDAALVKKLADAKKAINDNAGAKELYNALLVAEAAVAKHIGAKGSDFVIAKNLNDAIVAFAQGGGTVTDELNDILSVFNVINLAGEEASVEDGEYSDFFTAVEALSGEDFVFEGATKALQDAIKSAATVVSERAEKYGDLDDATDATDATEAAEGEFFENLESAESDIKTRDDYKAALVEAEAAYADAQAALAELKALVATYKTTVEATEAAQKALEDLGVDNLVVLDDGAFAGTAEESDLYLATEGDDSTLTNFEAADKLFIGTGLVASTLAADADLATERLGDAATLEVFFQQDGLNALIHIEAFAGAGNAKSLDDVTTITLTGVNVADLVYADGFISVAA